MTPTPKDWRELETFDSFFAGLSMKDEKNAMKLYEKYISRLLSDEYERGKKETAIVVDKNYTEFLKGDGSEFSRKIRETIENQARQAELSRVIGVVEGMKEKKGWMPLGKSDDPWNKALTDLLTKLKNNE